MTIKEAINKVVNRIDLEEDEMTMVMESIMEGKTTSAQIASFITALRIKGETVNEIVGAVKVMREKATKITLYNETNNTTSKKKEEVIIDIVGTGGDSMKTFNISTAAAFIVASGGVKVAKHGNRSVSSSCGSADVLEKLGISIELTPETAAKYIDEIGMAFLFAPLFHSSTRHAASTRKEIGIRTIFNMIGPLTNPALVRHLLVGVYNKELCEIFAQVLTKFNTKRAMIIHGLDGMDEISITTDTKVVEIKEDKILHYLINPRDFGMKERNIEDIKGGDAEKNADILKKILSGKDNGAKRDVALLNAGAAFYIADICKNMRDGIEYGQEMIDSGKALKKLEEMIRMGDL